MRKYSLCIETEEEYSDDIIAAYMEVDSDGKYVLAAEAEELQAACEAALDFLKAINIKDEEPRIFGRLATQIVLENTRTQLQQAIKKAKR